MKCLLTTPAWRIAEIRSPDSRSVAGVWPMPGLLYIAAALRQAGHEVRVLDGAFHTREELLREIAGWRPDLLGLYSVAMMWPRAGELLQQAKAAQPGLFTVVGGPAPTALLEGCFAEGAVDAVVFGEGERTAVELASRLAEGRSLAGVAGCLYRDGGRVVANPPREPLADLDSLPFPAYDLVAHYPYRPSYGQVRRIPAAVLVSSRGCPHSCIFCFRSEGTKLRLRSPGSVVDEMERYVIDFGVREIRFWDDHFTADRERVLGIGEEILRRGIKVEWWCASRVDAVDEELLRLMKRSGCWCINFGMESGVDKNLAALNKGTIVEQGVRAVELTHRIGICTLGSYLFGIPGETVAEGLETIRLACRLNHYYAEFFPLTPFPGTELYANAPRYGRVNVPLERLGMLFKAAPFVSPAMSEVEVVSLLDRAYTTYYSRPSFVLRRLAGIRSWYEAQAIYFGGIAILKMLARRLAGRPPCAECRH